MNSLATSRPPPELVLFPKLPEAVLLQPIGQVLRMQALQRRRSLFQISHEHVFRLKMVQEQGGLSGENDLRFGSGGPDEAGQHCDRIWMETEFGLIDNDNVWAKSERLQKQRAKTDKTERAVGQGGCVEVGVGGFVNPFQLYFIRITAKRL